MTSPSRRAKTARRWTIRQHGIDMATCSTAPSSASFQKAINERDAVGLALATGSAALLPGGGQAMWGLGAGANAGISYLADGTIDPTNAAIAGWVNVISMGNGWRVPWAGMLQVARLETGWMGKIHYLVLR